MVHSKTVPTGRGGRTRRSTALAAAVASTLALGATSVARADADLDALKQQVQALQQKIDAMEKKQQAAAAPAPAAASTAAPAAAAGGDGAFSLYGVTLSGVLDVGLSFLNHGAPLSDTYSAGVYSYINKFNTRSYFGGAENNLSQSSITLSGDKEIMNGWSGIFRLQTAINPLSGSITDNLKSLTVNNGKPCSYTAGVGSCTYVTGADSSVAGELFNSAAYVGLSHKAIGTITFGRQNGLLADGVAKYDPMAASQAFSVIGISGTAAGGGNTENRRLDNSIKYSGQLGGLHIGAQYQFDTLSGSTASALQLVVGGTFPSGSVDVFYAKKNDAIGSASLSAAQVAALNCPYAYAAGPGIPATCAGVTGGGGNPLDKSLSGTITDTTTYSLMTVWNVGKAKLYGSYEHIQFSNPSSPVQPGALTLGGYVLAFVNNASIPAGQSKVFQFVWLGAKFPVTPALDWTVAWYRQEQSAFAAGASAGCNTNASAQCSGLLNAISSDLVYKASKRFDVYGGMMWSDIKGGLANGYLYTTEVNPTVGVRYTF